MLPKEKKRIIEALLFVAREPLTVKLIKEILAEETDGEEINSLIAQLQTEYEEQERSFRIVEVAGGFEVCTRPEYARWAKKLFGTRQNTRLSRPSLETLAVVAYQQPVTRQEIEGVRGVNVEGVLAGLLEKRLIKIVGRKDAVGRPMIYGTTREFLEYFGLKSLAELPSLEKFEAAVPTEVKTDGRTQETA